MRQCHSQTELARPPKHIALNNKSKIRLPLNILHGDFFYKHPLNISSQLHTEVGFKRFACTRAVDRARVTCYKTCGPVGSSKLCCIAFVVGMFKAYVFVSLLKKSRLRKWT